MDIARRLVDVQIGLTGMFKVHLKANLVILPHCG